MQFLSPRARMACSTGRVMCRQRERERGSLVLPSMPGRGEILAPTQREEGEEGGRGGGEEITACPVQGLCSSAKGSTHSGSWNSSGSGSSPQTDSFHRVIRTVEW